MRSARSILWLCSPSTQETASTTLDLPQPFGPTMQVTPVPLNVIGVFSQNDLKPNSSTLRSFSTRLLAWSASSSDASRTDEAASGFCSGGISRQKRSEGRYPWPFRLALSDRRLRKNKVAWHSRGVKRRFAWLYKSCEGVTAGSTFCRSNVERHGPAPFGNRATRVLLGSNREGLFRFLVLKGVQRRDPFFDRALRLRGARRREIHLADLL